MKVTCSGCGARHWLPDMNVAGGACRVVCPNCSSESYVDASMIEPQVLEARGHLAVNGETVGPVSAHDIEHGIPPLVRRNVRLGAAFSSSRV